MTTYLLTNNKDRAATLYTESTGTRIVKNTQDQAVRLAIGQSVTANLYQNGRYRVSVNGYLGWIDELQVALTSSGGTDPTPPPVVTVGARDIRTSTNVTANGELTIVVDTLPADLAGIIVKVNGVPYTA